MLLSVPISFLFSTIVLGISHAQHGNGQSKPNILFIFTDDQDLELGSMNYLPTVRTRIRDEGKKNLLQSSLIAL